VILDLPRPWAASEIFSFRLRLCTALSLWTPTNVVLSVGSMYSLPKFTRFPQEWLFPRPKVQLPTFPLSRPDYPSFLLFELQRTLRVGRFSTLCLLFKAPRSIRTLFRQPPPQLLNASVVSVQPNPLHFPYSMTSVGAHTPLSDFRHFLSLLFAHLSPRRFPFPLPALPVNFLTWQDHPVSLVSRGEDL